jgi:tRNA (guanine-N7-)-methyltransferase
MTDTQAPGSGAEGPSFRPADRKFYGRLHGKALKPGQQRWMEEDLPRLALPGGRAPLDLPSVFGPDRPVWLEIGFGGGEHLVHQAQTYPDVGLIGAEPFVNGIAAALGRIKRAGVGNVRLHPGDVRDLFDRLADGCLDKAFLLYPDPWPKRRHHGRRFVNPGPLGALARCLRPGAELRLATDVPDYAAQARRELPKAGFAIVAESRDPWSDWTRTRYEAKALREGRVPVYITCRNAG